MVNKPLPLVRNEYMVALCDLTNKSELPAFVKLEVLERLVREVQNMVQAELQQSAMAYKQALEAENAKNDEEKHDSIPDVE